MEEKKLTDEEIVQALECCAQEDGCCDCPVWTVGIPSCVETIATNTLDFIHRLQDENALLKEQIIGECKEHEEFVLLAKKTVDQLLVVLLSEREKHTELQKQVDELKEEQKNLDWYKMWHKKSKIV